MSEYTIVVIHGWSKNGDDIKKILHNYNLKWNSTKILDLKYKDLLNIFSKFQLTKLDFVFNETDIGSSGIWENEKEAVKIIKIESNNDVIDDVILMYKGIEKEFYIEFLKRCKDICPLIRKIVDNKIAFEKRINVGLIEKLNNKDEEKKVKIKNFNTKIELMRGFSDEFKKKWIKCIEKN